jgi:hypothetical protein
MPWQSCSFYKTQPEQSPIADEQDTRHFSGGKAMWYEAYKGLIATIKFHNQALSFIIPHDCGVSRLFRV